jgi:hypothetical protein
MESDKQELRQLLAARTAATKAGDLKTVLTLMADDVACLQAGQPPMIGRSAFATAAQGQPLALLALAAIAAASIRPVLSLGRQAVLAASGAK